MSATGRSDKRKANDYYVTPVPVIQQFLGHWDWWNRVKNHGIKILDPCAGGRDSVPMSYPVAMSKPVDTLDVRQDSLATWSGVNYLEWTPSNRYHLIISNPPYSLASEFVEKAMDEITDFGRVVFLLRLSFLSSKKRKKLFHKFPLEELYVHSARPSFTKGGTDATDYAHFVWCKNPPDRYFKGHWV